MEPWIASVKCSPFLLFLETPPQLCLELDLRPGLQDGGHLGESPGNLNPKPQIQDRDCCMDCIGSAIPERGKRWPELPELKLGGSISGLLLLV